MTRKNNSTAEAVKKMSQGAGDRMKAMNERNARARAQEAAKAAREKAADPDPKESMSPAKQISSSRDDLKNLGRVAEDIEKLKELQSERAGKQESEEMRMENPVNSSMIETLAKLKTAKESKSVQKNLKMTPSESNALKAISKTEGISVNGLICAAIDQFIERYIEEVKELQKEDIS